jgi:hypothetical protein
MKRRIINGVVVAATAVALLTMAVLSLHAQSPESTREDAPVDGEDCWRHYIAAQSFALRLETQTRGSECAVYHQDAEFYKDAAQLARLGNRDLCAPKAMAALESKCEAYKARIVDLQRRDQEAFHILQDRNVGRITLAVLSENRG